MGLTCRGCGGSSHGPTRYNTKYSICRACLESQEEVQIDGVSSRWCSLCGRYEPLTAFDDERRSCRAALLRHNKRRNDRKQRLRAPDAAQRATQTGAARAASAGAAAAGPLSPEWPTEGQVTGASGSHAADAPSEASLSLTRLAVHDRTGCEEPSRQDGRRDAGTAGPAGPPALQQQQPLLGRRQREGEPGAEAQLMPGGACTATKRCRTTASQGTASGGTGPPAAQPPQPERPSTSLWLPYEQQQQLASLLGAARPSGHRPSSVSCISSTSTAFRPVLPGLSNWQLRPPQFSKPLPGHFNELLRSEQQLSALLSEQLSAMLSEQHSTNWRPQQQELTAARQALSQQTNQLLARHDMQRALQALADSQQLQQQPLQQQPAAEGRAQGVPSGMLLQQLLGAGASQQQEQPEAPVQRAPPQRAAPPGLWAVPSVSAGAASEPSGSVWDLTMQYVSAQLLADVSAAALAKARAPLRPPCAAGHVQAAGGSATAGTAGRLLSEVQQALHPDQQHQQAQQQQQRYQLNTP